MENQCKNVKELTLNNNKERFLNGNQISSFYDNQDWIGDLPESEEVSGE